jgi:hypothetical protein
MEKNFIFKLSQSLKILLAANVYVTGRQFLAKRRTLNKEISLIYRTEIRRPTIYKTEGQNLEPK